MAKKFEGRNPAAYALALRGAGGVMKDRRTARGGQTNRLSLYLAEAEEERDTFVCDFCDEELDVHCLVEGNVCKRCHGGW